MVAGHRGAGPDKSAVEKVAEQHADGADWQVQVRGEFRDRGGVVAEPHDRYVLGLQGGIAGRHTTSRYHDGDEVEVAPGRPGPSGCPGIVSNDRASLVVDPDLLRWLRHHHGGTTPRPSPPCGPGWTGRYRRARRASPSRTR